MKHVSIGIPIRYGLLLAMLAGAKEIPAVRVAAADDLPSIQSATGLSLEDLTGRAGIIFAGRVVSIEVSGEAGVAQTCQCVKVTFLVDEGIRNATSGELITINEWAGLWNSTAGERYRRGERLLMFYYKPNASGVTSPVGGDAGRFAIGSRDQIHLTPERRNSLLRSARLQEVQTANLNLNASQSLPYKALVRALRLMVAESR